MLLILFLLLLWIWELSLSLKLSCYENGWGKVVKGAKHFIWSRFWFRRAGGEGAEFEGTESQSEMWALHFPSLLCWQSCFSFPRCWEFGKCIYFQWNHFGLPFLSNGNLFQWKFPTGCLKALHGTMGLVASETRAGKYLEFNVSYFYFHS